MKSEGNILNKSKGVQWKYDKVFGHLRSVLNIQILEGLRWGWPDKTGLEMIF
jgi:hypothetical protein